MRAPFFIGVVIAAALAACTGDDTAAPTDAGAVEAASESGASTLVDRGKGFVATRGCGNCHETPDMPGVLAGRSAPIPGTSAYPSNLTPDPDTGIDGWSDEVFVAALRGGVDDQGVALCTPMPHYGDMGDDEAKAIVAYLRSLAPVHHYVPDSDCPEKHVVDGGVDGAIDAASDGGGDSATDAGGADASSDAVADAPDAG